MHHHPSPPLDLQSRLRLDYPVPEPFTLAKPEQDLLARWWVGKPLIFDPVALSQRNNRDQRILTSWQRQIGMVQVIYFLIRLLDADFKTS